MLTGNYSEKLTIAANQNIKERDYWLNKLAGEPEKTTFFYDRQTVHTTGTEPGEGGGEKAEWSFAFNGDIFQRLTALSNGSDLRLHMILTTALVALLNRYTGNTDIIVGTAIYKQARESEFINSVLALRNRVEEGTTFKELLLQVRKAIVEAVENQNYPIEILVERLNLPVVPGEFPLFDVAAILENIQDESYLRSIYYNVLFSFKRTETALEAVLAYNPLRFNESTLRGIAGHYSRLLETALRDIDVPVSGIRVLAPEEREQLLDDFNNNRLEVPEDGTICRLFREQAAQTPDRIAVIAQNPHPGGEHQLTYGELNKRANRLARVLRHGGVGPDAVVAVLADRSVEMIIGIMAIIKAGGAYLPLDPTYPRERIAFMLEDSKTRWLVTQKHLEDRMPGEYNGDLYHIEDPRWETEDPGNPESIAGPRHLVYVIYTSGSTGKPKGVMVQHDQFVNVGMGWRKEYRLREMEVNLLQMAGFSFDVFAGDIARTFLNGGKMVINPAGVLDPESFYRLLTIHRVTLVESTPSYLVPFMDYVYDNRLPIDSMQLLILGSDSCPVPDFRRLVQRFGKQMRIVNSYGVTEAAIDSSYYEEDEAGLPESSNVPIGKPLPDMRFYILDSRRDLLPIGVPGELYIGGASVTRGYLYREELTAQRFMADPFAPGGRMYNTGDLARWLPGGNVEFLGRGDYQVKIRGFRIELGEIENKLLEHDHIKEAVVVRKGEESGDKYLCGYIVSDEPLEASLLREYLGKTLPDYMIPWFFVRMDRMPLTPNGKVDRKALPEPEAGEQQPYVAPRDEIEKKLVDIWTQVLGVPGEETGIDTNFFDLGGNSLMAIVTGSKIHKAFDVKIQLTDIFELQTIREIAVFIKEASPERFIAIEPAPKREYYDLSSAQKRLYILQQMDRRSSAYNMPNMLRLDGELEKERLGKAFQALTRRHDSLRTSFQIVDGRPVQRIHDSVEFQIDYYDIAEIQTGIEDIINNFIRPFDLATAPLVRIGLVKTGEGDHIFLADIHHIISDAVSQNLLVRDLIALYRGETLPGLRIQYKDYTEWQNSRGEKEADTIKKQEEYWLKVFEDKIPVPALPTDYPRPEVKNFEGTDTFFDVREEVNGKIRDIAAGTGATVYMVLLAAFNVLLARYCRREDIVVGSVTAGRGHPDLENVIGMFVNTLVLRNFPQMEKSFGAFLEEVKERALTAYENQDYPFENLVDNLPVDRNTGRDPLFDVMFVMDNAAPVPPASAESSAPSPYEFGTRTSKFDLTVYALEMANRMRFTFEYSTKLFKQETIEGMFRDYERILEAVGDNNHIKIKDIQLESRLDILTNSFQDVELNI
ncbi:MAG: amino acid adenylation domain-containing protein [bacterium]|nr:amino acid adenylation domain-containing protein [bacterium]